MGSKDPSEKPDFGSPAQDINLELPKSEIDNDALRLAAMGYHQEINRKFSIWSILGSAFTLTNSWFGVAGALATGINSGGPALLIYGIILCCLISICIGISLSELASAFPSSAGQILWANELAPRRVANLASYVTGWFAFAGAVFTSAAVASSVASAMVGCWQLTHSDLTISPWMNVVAYQLINLFAFFFNCHGRALPMISNAGLYTSLISFLVILIAVPAKAPTHADAKFVFATFINNTGWHSDGIAFIVGLINTNWAFACLDCATHLAEEVPRPERHVPLAIMWTVAIGFVTSWFFSISVMFAISNFDQIYQTSTLVPLLELFYQAVGTRAGAVVLEAFVIATGILCLISSHTWQSRLCWSFARDRGVPGHQWLSKVHPLLDVPLTAHVASCMLVALIGLLLFSSSTAFSSLVTASIVLLDVSYAIPVASLLAKGRRNIQHGPFWMNYAGFISNIVILLWTLFAVTMYSFPPVQPVVGKTMNYVCAIYGILVLIIVVDWFLRGRKSYRGRTLRHEEALKQESSLEKLRENAARDQTHEGDVK